jgi:SAM-dependent methyltransferase
MSAGNDGQVKYWNGPIGKVWAREQEKRDRDHAPITDAVIDLAAPKPGEAVLDIGCGSGTTTLLLAERVAPNGRAVGIDLSGPMLEVARRRAKETGSIATFVEADATDYAFAPASFDLAFSQFGVMFFADPVATFANIRRALRPNARLVFACWRGPEEHLWSSIPEEAAKPFLPPAPPVNFNAPGRFGFAMPERVRQVLSDAGFRDVALQAFDAPVFVGATPDEAASSAIDAGPLMRTLADADEETRERVRGAVTARLAQEMTTDGIFLNAAAWLVSARV